MPFFRLFFAKNHKKLADRIIFLSDCKRRAKLPLPTALGFQWRCRLGFEQKLLDYGKGLVVHHVAGNVSSENDFAANDFIFSAVI